MLLIPSDKTFLLGGSPEGEAAFLISGKPR
jgi:hypothetical protein